MSYINYANNLFNKCCILRNLIYTTSLPISPKEQFFYLDLLVFIPAFVELEIGFIWIDYHRKNRNETQCLIALSCLLLCLIMANVYYYVSSLRYSVGRAVLITFTVTKALEEITKQIVKERNKLFCDRIIYAVYQPRVAFTEFSNFFPSFEIQYQNLHGFSYNNLQNKLPLLVNDKLLISV